MVVFGMDGVLVDFNCWQAVHRHFNVKNEDNLRRYLNGEIDYVELMKREIPLWGKNIHIDTIKDVLAKAPLMKGAKSTIKQLRKAGYKTAIITAGFSILADHIRDELGIDHAFANKIMVNENGMLTGGKEVVDILNRIAVLRELASKEQITLRSCAVVGDSVFDIPLFKEVGFSIAFNTDDKGVKAAADTVIKDKDLKKILPYFIV